MSCFEEEGSWSMSFSGSGFLGLYHLGVIQCLRERAPHLLQGARRIYGSSSGALSAVCIMLDKSMDFWCYQLLGLVKEVEQLSLGTMHPSFRLVEEVLQRLRQFLPDDIHILASQRLGISLTHWPDGRNVIVTDFASREEVIQALICSIFIPVYCGMIPPEFRGERYIDGALSNNLPFADCPSTITVSPFPGTVDICPQSFSANLFELNTFNASFQISTMNLSLLVICLLTPSSEVLAHYCRQGYLDALRFLERRGLTREPVLWTLVSKKPPAPVDGTQDTGHDRGQKAGLSYNWAVPSVLVKDVPNFELLSPELENALKRICMRDPSPWARFWRSKPGKALTYLLLPYTLPVQYVYYQGRRLVTWLPDVPADLWWMQSVLSSVALGVYSRTKDRVLGLVSPPVSSCLQPEAAPSVDLDQNPWPVPPIGPEGHQAGPAQ